jgi:hypothetical protein
VRKTVRYVVNVRERDIGVLLDMLRYENANVRDWGRWSTEDRGDIGWRVTIESAAPTFDRWLSFGIHPKQIV